MMPESNAIITTTIYEHEWLSDPGILVRSRYLRHLCWIRERTEGFVTFESPQAVADYIVRGDAHSFFTLHAQFS
jgi:hypothetical protein